MGLDLYIVDNGQITETIPDVHFTSDGYYRWKCQLIIYAIEYISSLSRSKLDENSSLSNDSENDKKRNFQYSQLLKHLNNLILKNQPQLTVFERMTNFPNHKINQNYLNLHMTEIKDLLISTNLYGILELILHSDYNGSLSVGNSYDIHLALKLLFDCIEENDKPTYLELIEFFRIAYTYKKAVQYS
jgi:hypothetical protein